MIKNIIREVPAEYADFSYYFDDDELTGKSGDFCNTLFILNLDRWGRIDGFNADVYKDILSTARELAECIDDVTSGEKQYFQTIKEIMPDFGFTYNPTTCHKLKEWAASDDFDSVGGIAEYLTIKTGREWSTSSARGYCQGDYVDILYCVDAYKDGVEQYGEIWLGAATEFCVVDLDADGNEIDACYSYIVADCQAWKDEDRKRLVCKWAGIEPEETALELIDGYKTTTKYSYRTA